MFSRQDIQRLIHRGVDGQPVLSVFLDMSVNSENKRTHDIFLNKEKARYDELDSDRPGHHRVDIGEAFARIERWLGGEYRQANKGVALFIAVGGDWMETLQFPVPVSNRLTVAEQPVVGPLVEVLEQYHHHGVVLVDREHMRLLSLYLDQAVYEREVTADPYPTSHDVKRGGYSARDYQSRKAEEVKHFFKDFSDEVAEFDRQHAPDDLILLGTDENVKQFREFLPSALQEKIVHTERAPVDAGTAAILERLQPFFRRQEEEEQASTVNELRDRVRQEHLAVAGFHDTLEQIQEGKVETLVMARNLERSGVACEKCGFYLARHDDTCPYCGGTTKDGVDIVEALVRIASEQDVRVEFVPAESMGDLNGVGGLLRY